MRVKDPPGPDAGLALARLCYHLGNRHVTLAIGEDEQGSFVRFPPDHVLEELAERLGAIVVHKFRTALTGPLSFLAILPAAVPGIVLGLGYILVFNSPANPLNFLYGTFALIVILEVYYNHAHAFLISSTSLKQIGAAKTLDDLVLAAYVGAGCADALLLSGLIDIEAYHEQNPAGQLAFSA